MEDKRIELTVTEQHEAKRLFTCECCASFGTTSQVHTYGEGCMAKPK